MGGERGQAGRSRPGDDEPWGGPKSAREGATQTGSTEAAFMQLDAKQVTQFNQEGWLFLPGCFREEEVAILRSQADIIFKLERPQIWREKSGAPRTGV